MQYNTHIACTEAEGIDQTTYSAAWREKTWTFLIPPRGTFRPARPRALRGSETLLGF